MFSRPCTVLLHVFSLVKYLIRHRNKKTLHNLSGVSKMANSLLTINMITREAVALWKNTNAFIQNIDVQYDDSFAATGAKIGTTLRIRLPNDYTVRTGAALQAQDTSEQSITLTVATQQGRRFV